MKIKDCYLGVRLSLFSKYKLSQISEKNNLNISNTIDMLICNEFDKILKEKLNNGENNGK